MFRLLKLDLGEALLLFFTAVLMIFSGIRTYTFVAPYYPTPLGGVVTVSLMAAFMLWAVAIALGVMAPALEAIAWGMWLLNALALTALNLATVSIWPLDSAVILAKALPWLMGLNVLTAFMYRVLSVRATSNPTTEVSS